MAAQIDIAKSIRGFVEVHVLNTGIELGIFRALSSSQGLTPSELAVAINVPERVTVIWCNTAFAFGIVDRRNGRTFLKPELIEPLAEEGSTKYAGDFLKVLVGHLGKDMQNQAAYVRAGKSYRFTDHDLEFVRPISKRGAQRGRLFLEKILPMVPGLEETLSAGIRMLDVGCGGGSFLLTLAKAFNKSRFVGMDVCVKSVTLANEACQIQNMADRVEFFEGSPSGTNLGGPFDLVTMNLVLHEMDPQQRPSEVKAINECMKEGGQLLLLEFPYPEEEQDFFLPQYGMGILDQYYELIWGTEHLPWSGQQQILKDAGFRDIDRTFLGDNVYVLIRAKK